MMKDISPKSPPVPGSLPPPPPGSIIEWDEAGVNQFFKSMGLDGFESVIYEHGISGDVLCALDNETLLDLGMHSLGHRLNVLRAVFELKKEQHIELDDDDWRPQEEVAMEAMETAATLDRMWNLVLEQQERLAQLEEEHVRLIRTLQDNGIVVQSKPPTIMAEAAGTPPTSIGYRFESPSQFGPLTAPPTTTSHPGTSSTPKPPPLHRQASGPPTTTARPAPSAQLLAPNTAATTPIPTSPTPPANPANNPQASDRHIRSDAQTAAKSFRVTMDDPCERVLPAALKKYKVKEDWRQYALFICYGNTERCLSYDEKPLLLFQKLKENGSRPVFMLRHIRDIKSPIAVAQQKQAVRLGKDVNTTENLLPTLEPMSPTSPPVATTLTVGGQAGPSHSDQHGRTPNAGTFPELPSPGMKENGTSSAASDATLVTTPGTLKDKDGKVHRVTYAISIYPYIADKADELDVAVGATFVVMSKAKGWWFVQKDPDGAGQIVSDPTKSAWVPAGCLLELSTPVTAVSPRSPGWVPGKASLPSNVIMSSSYPGKILMTYTAKDDTELSLAMDDKIRVYKKYCHWSYCVKEDTGQRGWAPAWFIGKVQPSDGQAVTSPVPPLPSAEGTREGSEAPTATSPKISDSVTGSHDAQVISVAGVGNGGGGAPVKRRTSEDKAED